MMPPRSFPFAESLEPRRLLAAGGVAATVIDGRLIVTGDNAQNVVRLDGLELSAGQVRVSGLGSNTINGHYKSIIFDGVTRGVRVELARGDDILVVASLDLSGGLTVYAGSGNDSVHMDTAWAGAALSVLAGTGDDRVQLDRISARRDVTLDAGDGTDQLGVGASWFKRGVSLITAGAADDVIAATDSRFSARTAGGADDLSLAGSTFLSTTSVKTGDGDDGIFLGGSTFAQAPILDDGAGRDTVDRDGFSRSFDFREGKQGWEAGFADYPAGPTGIDADGNPTYAKEDYELDSGLRPLPSDLTAIGRGFLLSGRNRSDDLFMFLKRKLTAADGVLPGQAYRVAITIMFASDAPSDAGGAGGPPGEAVFLKAGGTAEEPKAILKNGDYRMNINKVDDPVDGRLSAASGAGNIANGTHVSIENSIPPYISLVRHHVHTAVITATAQGELWLLVGTDSGTEGTTTLYYQSINVLLTPVSE